MSESNYTLQPEVTNFSPFQDHVVHIPRPTNKHLQPHINQCKQVMNTTCIQKTKPLCIPIPKDTKCTKNGHFSTSTDFQMPSSPTPLNAQTTVEQPTLPTQKTFTAPAHPQWTRKIPLLPTPPASAREFNNRNHYRQFISRPSPPRYNINSTFSGPLTFTNNRLHQQPHIPGPQHQGNFTGPYPQAPGHFPPQVSTYIPVLLPYPNQLITSLQYYAT